MKTPERFNRAIAALVKAFFDGTLQKGSDCQCAVGNMCGGVANDWYWAVMFYRNGNEGIPKSILTRGLSQVSETGYSLEEIVRIEYAFEHNTHLFSGDRPTAEVVEDQYSGLMAVVDVLCEIEGIEATETKKLFEYAI